MLRRSRLAGVAGVAALLALLAAPAVARDLGLKLGGSSVGAGLPGGGSSGIDLGIGAGAGASSSGNSDLSAGADAQVTTPGAPFRGEHSTETVPLGLDRFEFRGDGSTNVSVFYKFVKTKF